MTDSEARGLKVAVEQPVIWAVSLALGRVLQWPMRDVVDGVVRGAVHNAVDRVVNDALWRALTSDAGVARREPVHLDVLRAMAGGS